MQVIAVLDDEPEMRKALRRLLTTQCFRVEEFESGKEFLSALDSHTVQCLLLDLQMPEFDGFDVLEALRSRTRRVPVVVVTAHDEPETVERARALGVSAYLKKPVDRDALFAAIASATSTNPKP